MLVTAFSTSSNHKSNLAICAVLFPIEFSLVPLSVWFISRMRRQTWQTKQTADGEMRAQQLAEARYRAAEAARTAEKARLHAWALTPEQQIVRANDPGAKARELTTETGNGGFFVGITPDTREWLTAPSKHGVLVLGPSQSGKTTGVIIPGILSAAGPVVSTSTKLDVLNESYRVRAQLGRVWLFDPSGTEKAAGAIPPGVLELHWSPLFGSRTWDGAREMADAMVKAARPRAEEDSASIHWTSRARDLLGPLLHSAALQADGTIALVQEWIAAYDLVSPMEILHFCERQRNERSLGASLALDTLRGVSGSPQDERGSIVSTAADVMSVYNSEHGRTQALTPNFDPVRFVQGSDTVYIAAPGLKQRMCAPIIVGLLHDIRNAAFDVGHRAAGVPSHKPPVLWMLDEVANIAPLSDLPDMLSEAGGQGLQIVACLQDMAQARKRWGKEHGLLSKCRTKVIFPGIGEKEDLEALSTILGDWDRDYTTTSETTGTNESFGTSSGRNVGRRQFSSNASTNTTVGYNTSSAVQYTSSREHLLSPSEVSRLPRDHALVIRNTEWALIQTLSSFNSEVWLRMKEMAATTVPTGEADILPPVAEPVPAVTVTAHKDVAAEGAGGVRGLRPLTPDRRPTNS